MVVEKVRKNYYGMEYFKVLLDEGLELETEVCKNSSRHGSVTVLREVNTQKRLAFSRVNTLWGNSQRYCSINQLFEAIQKDPAKFAAFFNEYAEERLGRPVFLEEKTGKYWICNYS